MNSCLTGYYSAINFGYFIFSSIFKSLGLWGNYLCHVLGTGAMGVCDLLEIYNNFRETIDFF
jgi:hypothetical protein